jgi:serine/threonine protein phosphatase 1
MKKTYVIGDIHGCIETLKELYNRLEPDSIVYSVGDLVDKGPNSLEVVDFCIENDIKVIMGNHEHLFLTNTRKYLSNDNINDGRWYNEWGGDRTIDSYKNDKQKLLKHIKYIESLPNYVEITIKGINYFITHGFGLPYYDIRDDESAKRPMMSNRLKSKHYNIENVDELSKFNVVNIFGHDADDMVRWHDLFICIDTACTYGNFLTAIELGSRDVITQKVLDKVDYE